MAEAAKRDDIPNVFAMKEPGHMWHKFAWELQHLTQSLSVWEGGDDPEPIFRAFNTAVTAWHISDWLWQSSPEARDKLSKRFNFDYQETSKGIRKGLGRFQDAVGQECRELYVCRELAKGSKHMRSDKPDPDVKALAKWSPVVDGVGLVKPGDLVLGLFIEDAGSERDAVLSFIDAFGFWEKLISSEKLLASAERLPNKVIKNPLE